MCGSSPECLPDRNMCQSNLMSVSFSAGNEVQITSPAQQSDLNQSLQSGIQALVSQQDVFSGRMQRNVNDCQHFFLS